MNEMRALRSGWRLRVYRGRHRTRGRRAGQLATGLALLIAVHLS